MQDLDESKRLVRAFAESINDRDWLRLDELVAAGVIAEPRVEWDDLAGLVQLGHRKP